MPGPRAPYNATTRTAGDEPPPYEPCSLYTH